MADLADAADRLQAEHLAASLARARAAVPAGVPGECNECGEDMPRLVDGRCGFCRDGRTPPSSFLDRPAPAPPALPVPRAAEPTVMPNPPGKANITVTVDGAVYDFIAARAAGAGTRLSQATRELIEGGIRALEAPSTAPAPSTVPGMVDLAAVPFNWLTEELSRRVEQYAASARRAEALEVKLARVTEALTGEPA